MRNLLMLSQDHARLIVEIFRKVLIIIENFIEDDKKMHKEELGEIEKLHSKSLEIRRMMMKELHETGGMLVNREDLPGCFDLPVNCERGSNHDPKLHDFLQVGDLFDFIFCARLIDGLSCVFLQLIALLAASPKDLNLLHSFLHLRFRKAGRRRPGLQISINHPAYRRHYDHQGDKNQRLLCSQDATDHQHIWQ